MKKHFITEYYDFASKLADAAKLITLSYFRSSIKIEAKLDDSPVSIADKKAEGVMRQMIESKYPSHGIIGEEYGGQNVTSEFVWILDPIDGTRSFVTGKPLFGTLICLLHQEQFIVGLIDMPALNERWKSALNMPTMFQENAVTCRPCKKINEAWLYATSPHMFTPEKFVKFEALRKSVYNTKYGADCHAYGLVASGWADLVCESSLKIYDFAALVPIIKGANGVITDWKGLPLSLESDGSILASGSQEIHEEALTILNR